MKAVKAPFSIERSDRRVADLLRMRTRINASPSYQRQSEAWRTPKRQLFIDSLLNGFDIPKLYFHDVSGEKDTKDKSFEYAVVDGKQRLEAIWAFADDEVELADDFYWYEDPDLSLSSCTYSTLPPKLQARFNDFKLPIEVIYTDDLQWVEELFSRLNEAVALNAPERRNAMGGPLPPIVRDLARHSFFSDHLPFENNRYKYLDLAAKFLYLEHRNEPDDTKRRTLDDFVEQFKERPAKEAKALETAATAVLDRLNEIFVEADALLGSLGLVVIYYLLERDETLSSTEDCREILTEFDGLRRQVRLLMRAAAAGAGHVRVQLDPDLVEFERLSQSPNDVAAMKFRMKTLSAFLSNPKLIKTRLRALT